MKSKFSRIFVTKILGGKMQFCPRNFTNIAEKNQKIHYSEFVENFEEISPKKQPGNF